MGVSNLPVVFSRNKHSVSIIGHASDFDSAASMLRDECKDAGVKFNSKLLRCFSSSARIVLHDRVDAAFPCFLYEHKKKEDVVEIVTKTHVSRKLKISSSGSKSKLKSKAKGTR